MTRCRWPTPPQDNKEIAVLFRASGGGARIRAGLHVPDGVLMQFQEKGSYRLHDVLAYLEWILDRSRLGGVEADGADPDLASSCGEVAVPGLASNHVVGAGPDQVSSHAVGTASDLASSRGEGAAPGLAARNDVARLRFPARDAQWAVRATRKGARRSVLHPLWLDIFGSSLEFQTDGVVRLENT